MERPQADVIVLAGSRGPDDPVAKAAGVEDKALAEVAGKPMLRRVLETVRSCEWVDTLVMMSSNPEATAPLEVAPMSHVDAAKEGPAASVQKALDLPALVKPPILVVTADNPLLTAERLTAFYDEARALQADVVVGLTPSSVVLERFPEAKRTFLPFKDERYSGTNLFALLTSEAGKAANFWRTVEKDRKNPVKLVRHFGLSALAGFLARRWTLDEAMEIASQKIGARCKAVHVMDPLAPIDVDKPEDLELVRRLLEEERR